MMFVSTSSKPTNQPTDINSQSQLVAVAQSSRSVLVPSCMLHGDREPVPSDPVYIELQNLNSCTELPEEMTSIFNLRGLPWEHGMCQAVFFKVWAK